MALKKGLKKNKKWSKSKLKAEAWKQFSIYIRTKYLMTTGLICYTCSKPLTFQQTDAGHGIAGRGNFILFCEEVIKPQCKGCNVFQSGNYNVFIPKLIDEIGRERYEYLLKESKKPLNIKYNDMKDIYDKYLKLNEEMKEIAT